MPSPDYDNQFLAALQNCDYIENKAMDVRNRLANAAASHQSMQLASQDIDTLTERNQAWEKFIELARRPY